MKVLLKVPLLLNSVSPCGRRRGRTLFPASPGLALGSGFDSSRGVCALFLCRCGFPGREFMPIWLTGDQCIPAFQPVNAGTGCIQPGTLTFTGRGWDPTNSLLYRRGNHSTTAFPSRLTAYWLLIPTPNICRFSPPPSFPFLRTGTVTFGFGSVQVSPPLPWRCGTSMATHWKT